MTRGDQLARLWVLRGAPEDGREHLRALTDLPDAVLEAAIDHALKTRVFFPAPAELRSDADIVAVKPAPRDESARTVELAQPFTVTIPQVGTVVSVAREWRYDCLECSDTGWKSWYCRGRGVPEDASRQPWIETAQCERYRPHHSHEFVAHCACYASNPTLVRRRENAKKYAAAEPARTR